MAKDLSLAQRIIREKEGREVDTRSIATSYYQPGPKGSGPLALPGTITFFVGDPGSALLARATELVRENGADQGLVDQVSADFAKLPTTAPSEDERWEAIASKPVLLDIRYAGKTLASTLFDPGPDGVAVVVCPYNGGPLADDAFEAVSYRQPGSDASLEVLAAIGAPQLSDVEEAALKEVPQAQREMNVGVAINEGFPEYAALFILGVVAGYGIANAAVHVYHWAVGSEPQMLEADAEVLFDDSSRLTVKEVTDLGPVGSARELLQARRAVLSGR